MTKLVHLFVCTFVYQRPKFCHNKQMLRHNSQSIVKHYLYSKDEESPGTDTSQERHHGLIFLLLIRVKHSLGHHLQLQLTYRQLEMTSDAPTDTGKYLTSNFACTQYQQYTKNYVF